RRVHVGCRSSGTSRSSAATTSTGSSLPWLKPTAQSTHSRASTDPWSWSAPRICERGPSGQRVHLLDPPDPDCGPDLNLRRHRPRQPVVRPRLGRAAEGHFLGVSQQRGPGHVSRAGQGSG
ncbi:unnamed protein product, partial [Linum tenue]